MDTRLGFQQSLGERADRSTIIEFSQRIRGRLSDILIGVFEAYTRLQNCPDRPHYRHFSTPSPTDRAERQRPTPRLYRLIKTCMETAITERRARHLPGAGFFIAVLGTVPLEARPSLGVTHASLRVAIL